MHTSITDSVEKPLFYRSGSRFVQAICLQGVRKRPYGFFGCLSFEGIRAHNLRHVEPHGVLQGLIYRLESADGVSSCAGLRRLHHLSHRNRR